MFKTDMSIFCSNALMRWRSKKNKDQLQFRNWIFLSFLRKVISKWRMRECGRVIFAWYRRLKADLKKRALKKTKAVKAKLEEQVKESAKSDAKYERLLEKEKEMGAAQADFLRGKQEKVALKMIRRLWNEQVLGSPCREAVVLWHTNSLTDI